MIYNVEDQIRKLDVTIPEGAYGVQVLDNHILVGTDKGCISYLTGPSFTNREISPPLHSSTIFDMVHLSTFPSGYNIASLGGDQVLRLTRANYQIFDETDESGACFIFQDYTKIQHNKTIATVDVMRTGERIVYAF